MAPCLKSSKERKRVFITVSHLVNFWIREKYFLGRRIRQFISLAKDQGVSLTLQNEFAYKLVMIGDLK